MDPTANLREQLHLAHRLLDDTGRTTYRDLGEYGADVDRLAELVLALDEWIKGSGYLPECWSRRA